MLSNETRQYNIQIFDEIIFFKYMTKLQKNINYFNCNGILLLASIVL